MKTSAIIPVNDDSKRLPCKVYLPIGTYKETMVDTIYDTLRNCRLNGVIIASNNYLKYSPYRRYIVSSQKHYTGTSRAIPIAEKSDADIIIIAQADEPFIKRQTINALIDKMEDTNADCGTVVGRIDKKEFFDSNIVRPIIHGSFIKDFDRVSNTKYKHIGIYAYKRKTLLKYHSLAICKREDNENLEQLRFTTNGYRYIFVEADYPTIAINTREDYLKALDLKL